MSNNDVKAVLGEAKELIVRNGWMQGQYGDADRGYCIYGAVCEAADRQGSPGLEIDAMAAINKDVRIVKTGIYSAISWNDRPGRTQDDVLALFDTVIAGLD